MRIIKKSDKIFTIKEVALNAGVSAGTVDRVLHKRGQVSTENIRKVNKIIKKIGYKPNIYARNLVLNKLHNFAALLPDNKELEYWKASHTGVDKAEEELLSLGVRTTKYLFDPYDPTSFNRQARKLLNCRPDGVLLAPILHEESEVFIKECAERKIPFVYIDSNISEHKPLSFIGQDPGGSGYMAAHLISYGNEKGNYLIITTAKKNDNHFLFSERIKGFKNYFAELRKDNNILEVNDIEQADVFKRLKSGEVNGIFVPNSRAYQTASFLEKNQLKKIRLIGYDLVEKNREYLRKGGIDFLINQNPQEQGYLAVQLLYRNVVLNQEIAPFNFMPLNIIVKENLLYY
jgi:LacI family transcriptional regulator